jgi:hypothetical protein
MVEIKSCELIPSFIIQYQSLHGYNQIRDETGTAGAKLGPKDKVTLKITLL